MGCSEPVDVGPGLAVAGPDRELQLGPVWPRGDGSAEPDPHRNTARGPRAQTRLPAVTRWGTWRANRGWVRGMIRGHGQH